MMRITSNSDTALKHLSPKQVLAVNLLFAYGYPAFVLLALQPFVILTEGSPFNGFTLILQTIYSLLMISIFDAPLFLVITLFAFFIDYRRIATRAITLIVSMAINHFVCKELIDSIYILDILWKIGLNSNISRLSITIAIATTVFFATNMLTVQDRQQTT